MDGSVSGSINSIYQAALAGQAADRDHLYRAARQLYRRSAFSGQVARLGGMLAGRSRRLRTLTARGNSGGGHYVGIRTVAVRDIRGSEGRATDFDAEFHPLGDHMEERWTRVALARLKGIVLPPVELIRVGTEYYVRDGHHRVSVARALGELYLDAEVTAWGDEHVNM